MPPPFPAPTRHRRRRPPLGPVRLAGDVLAAMATLRTTAPAEALGWSRPELAPVLAAFERSGLVEHRIDPDRPDVARVMLSGWSPARPGPALAPRGDRRDPDRPPGRTRGRAR